MIQQSQGDKPSWAAEMQQQIIQQMTQQNSELLLQIKKVTDKNKELEEHIEVLGEQIGVFGDETRDLKKQNSELAISTTDLQRSVDYLRLEVEEAERGQKSLTVQCGLMESTVQLVEGLLDGRVPLSEIKTPRFMEERSHAQTAEPFRQSELRTPPTPTMLSHIAPGLGFQPHWGPHEGYNTPHPHQLYSSIQYAHNGAISPGSKASRQGAQLTLTDLAKFNFGETTPMTPPNVKAFAGRINTFNADPRGFQPIIMAKMLHATQKNALLSKFFKEGLRLMGDESDLTTDGRGPIPNDQLTLYLKRYSAPENERAYRDMFIQYIKYAGPKDLSHETWPTLYTELLKYTTEFAELNEWVTLPQGYQQITIDATELA